MFANRRALPLTFIHHEPVPVSSGGARVGYGKTEENSIQSRASQSRWPNRRSNQHHETRKLLRRLSGMVEQTRETSCGEAASRVHRRRSGVRKGSKSRSNTSEKPFRRSVLQRLAREIKVWALLDHENVLPLLGFFSVENFRMPRLVSEWMEDGTMTDYMKTFPKCSSETQRMVRRIFVFLYYKPR